MASRVLFIDEGRLIYDGTVADLTKDGRPLDVAFPPIDQVSRY